MGYVRAEEILPVEIIELIQQYVDGTNIYVPRKVGNRAGWGEANRARKQIQTRDEIVPLTGKILDFKKDKIKIHLYNPYHIPIRIEKAAADILQISRGEAKRLIENGQVTVSLLSREME